MRLLLLLALLGLVGTVPAGTQPKALRILCYNIHHGEGTDGKLDLARIAGVVRAARPDLVFLQELTATRPSGS